MNSQVSKAQAPPGQQVALDQRSCSNVLLGLEIIIAVTVQRCGVLWRTCSKFSRDDQDCPEGYASSEQVSGR